MSKFVDELRQAVTIEGITQIELDHVKALLRENASIGIRKVQIAEFAYSEHKRLGKVRIDLDNSVTLEGPIKGICEELEKEGILLSFSEEPCIPDFYEWRSGNGVTRVTRVIASW